MGNEKGCPFRTRSACMMSGDPPFRSGQARAFQMFGTRRSICLT